jgi:hypothetical protein
MKASVMSNLTPAQRGLVYATGNEALGQTATFRWRKPAAGENRAETPQSVSDQLTNDMQHGHGYDFVAGQQLPDFEPGSAINIDGERLWLIVDQTRSAVWVDEGGVVNEWEIGEYDFTVDAGEPKLDEDGSGLRAAATLEAGDIVHTTTGIGTVKSAVSWRPRFDSRAGVLMIDTADGEVHHVLPGDEVRVTRPSATYVYDADGDYWDSVAAVGGAQSDIHTLNRVLDEQSEDDFMRAVIRNPNTTADTIDVASLHYATAVRRAAVFHPLVAEQTLSRIEVEAAEQALIHRASSKAEGIGPSTGYYDAMIRQNEDLATAAREQLALRYPQ